MSLVKVSVHWIRFKIGDANYFIEEVIEVHSLPNALNLHPNTPREKMETKYIS